MRARPALLTALAAFGVSACESFPVDLPGRGGSEPAVAPSTQRSAPDEVGEDDSRNGLAGAALCASAAYYLADYGAVDEASASALGDLWVSVLEVIPAQSPQERQEAIDTAYAAFDTMDQRGDSLGVETASATIDFAGCADPDFQRRYLARWGDPDLMEAMMQDTE